MVFSCRLSHVLVAHADSDQFHNLPFAGRQARHGADLPSVIAWLRVVINCADKVGAT
jgi:hypothetical protein